MGEREGEEEKEPSGKRKKARREQGRKDEGEELVLQPHWSDNSRKVLVALLAPQKRKAKGHAERVLGLFLRHHFCCGCHSRLLPTHIQFASSLSFNFPVSTPPEEMGRRSRPRLREDCDAKISIYFHRRSASSLMCSGPGGGKVGVGVGVGGMGWVGGASLGTKGEGPLI